MKPFFISKFAVALSVALAGAGCTTDSGTAGPPEASSVQGRGANAAELARPASFAFEIRAGETLSETISRFHEVSGAGIVLMNGLGARAHGPLAFENVDIASAIDAIARHARLNVYNGSGWTFLYPDPREVYAPLERMSAAGELGLPFRDLQTSAAFTEGIAIYDALALLSHTLDRTIVADNTISEVECGEVRLPALPLGNVLAALLQSARISPDMVEIESTGEYVFMRSTRNLSDASQLLAPDDVPERLARTLERTHDLTLPERPASGEKLRSGDGPIPLRNALPLLSTQLGIAVRAEHSLLNLPVTPVCMRNLRLSTALDLLLRQWPVAEFGYELDDSGIIIRHVPNRRPS